MTSPSGYTGAAREFRNKAEAEIVWQAQKLTLPANTIQYLKVTICHTNASAIDTLQSALRLDLKRTCLLNSHFQKLNMPRFIHPDPIILPLYPSAFVHTFSPFAISGERS
jgi:hypothetical protein